MKNDPTPKEIYSAIGQLEAKVHAIGDRLKRIESNAEFVRSAISEDGKAIAEISERCRIRGKQISQLMSRVGGCEEITGVFKLKDQHELRSTNTARWIVTTILSLVATIITILLWILSRK